LHRSVAAVVVTGGLLAAFFAACPSGLSATLSITNQTVNQGQTVAAPVQLAAGGQTIAALQFDLQWDPVLAVQVAPGITSRQGFKVLYSNAQAPGVLRCLIVGPDQSSLADGEVLDVFITAGIGAFPGTAQVRLTNIVATDDGGGAISMDSSSASVQIQNGVTLAFPAQTVLNTASLQTGPIAPGEVITVLDVPPASPAVFINGVSARVISSGAGGFNAIVPFELDLTGPADFQVRSQDGIVAEQSIPVAQVAPAIFTQTGTGAGPAAALNPDFTVNSFSNPATVNSVLMVFGTGFGLTQTPLADGQTAGGPAPLALPVSATIGGVAATVTYAGAAPNQIAGLTQINILLPDGLPSNPNTPIALTVANVTTPPGVTVSIH
jgi:uncharacterized protein (TIGR03437 family)